MGPFRSWAVGSWPREGGCRSALSGGHGGWSGRRGEGGPPFCVAPRLLPDCWLCGLRDKAKQTPKRAVPVPTEE